MPIHSTAPRCSARLLRRGNDPRQYAGNSCRARHLAGPGAVRSTSLARERAFAILLLLQILARIGNASFNRTGNDRRWAGQEDAGMRGAHAAFVVAITGTDHLG